MIMIKFKKLDGSTNIFIACENDSLLKIVPY